jgi:hypothetical protein
VSTREFASRSLTGRLTLLNLDKTVIEFPCPACKFTNAATVRDMRFGLTTLCRRCETRIRLTPMDAGVDEGEEGTR